MRVAPKVALAWAFDLRLRLRRFQRLGAINVAAALRSGKPVRTAGLALYRRNNDLDCARLALIVPKKLIPTAVARNRIRRLTREAFRLHQAHLSGLDCVVRVTRPLGEAGLNLADVQALMRRASDAQ
ncbi:MAG TPA: ribonuclease P protein component [Bryobacteraceae bacterium]|nr:ribonuclease P protein component [Bryobacteraceae bacterium]